MRQTYGHFTAPVESFEHAVKTGRIDGVIAMLMCMRLFIDYER